jgi:hypothetical protein
MSDTTPTTDLTPEPTPTRGRLSKRAWIAIAAGAAVVVLGGTGIAYAATDGFDMDSDDDDLRTSQQQGSGDTTDDSSDRDDTSTEASSTTDPDDAPISDSDRSKAEAAGLKAAGGTDGVVTDVDRSDDADHAWEVEVTFADNTDVDVELADDFSVVRTDKN